MGPIEISGFRQRNDRRIVDELLVYLVLHDSHHRSAEQIQAGLRPLADDHGNVDPQDHPQLPLPAPPLRRSRTPPRRFCRRRYLIHGVDSDWVIFQRLNREADTVGDEAARALRTEALRLVRGRPFDGVPADSYDWVDEEHLRTTIMFAVAECAQRLGSDLFEADDFAGAENAARSGVRGAPDDFGLWDLGARAIDARGDRTALGRWLTDAATHLDRAEMDASVPG